MNGDQPQRGNGTPPARGLRMLTWPQVEALDGYIADVCGAGYGTVVITVERGRPLFVSPRPSLRFRPARDIGN